MTTAALETLFGSKTSAGVLAFLAEFKKGYASEIARYLGANLFAVQKQLGKFEGAGLLTSWVDGRTRCYAFNPERSLDVELIQLISKIESAGEKGTTDKDHAPLPEFLRQFFWDYQFDQLDWNTDRDLLIRRILTDGSWQAITWLRHKTGDDALRQWLIAHRGRGLHPRQLHFWSLALAIPNRQADSWSLDKTKNPWMDR
jgi:hypothetical protein